LAVNLSIPYDELEKLIEDLENDVIRVTKPINNTGSESRRSVCTSGLRQELPETP
jgi:hypothetical protein